MTGLTQALPDEFNFVLDKVEIFNNEVYVMNKVSYLRVLKFFLYQSELDLRDEEPFYMFDVFDIIRKYNKWVEYFPRITPFYALKCHPHPIILQLLASLGTGFDCASVSELREVINYGVSPDRIVYANAIKFDDHLDYAAEHHIYKMTFDSTEELYKIKDNAPNASLILRVFVETTTARCPLGLKFGAPLDSVPSLVRLAKQLNLNLVGVSFHVGSGCTDADVYRKAIEDSHYVFEFAKSEGIQLKLLDIGGGFPGDFEYKSADELFVEISHVVNTNINKYFKEEDGYVVISEPGRYFAASAMQLVTRVLDEAPNLEDDPPEVRSYFINDGMHGSFNCVLFDHFIGESYVVRKSEFDEVEPSEIFHTYVGTNTQEKPQNHYSKPLYPTTIRGITGENNDVCIKNELLPEINVGDIVVFKNMGAYTRAAASRFCGHTIPRTYNFVYLEDLKSITHLLSDDDKRKFNL